MKALIIGLGNLGFALAKGLPAELFKELFCFDPSKKDATLPAPVQWFTKKSMAFDVVFLCVKPHDLPEVAAEWKDFKATTLVSFLAGTKIEKVRAAFPGVAAIVRAMPNIAATIGEAATCAAVEDKSKTDLAIVEKSLQSLGDLHWVKEEWLDAVTGLSGSGPAYVYLLIEALADGGVRVGLPRPLALELATQTVLGSAKLLKETKLHPAILRDQVVTPAGTTIAGLHELESHGMRAMLMDAVYAATKKCRELTSSF